MAEPVKPPSGKRQGARQKASAPLTEHGIFLRLTQRQLDYLGCAAILKLKQQDLIRMALDKWIDEQTGEPGL